MPYTIQYWWWQYRVKAKRPHGGRRGDSLQETKKHNPNTGACAANTLQVTRPPIGELAGQIGLYTILLLSIVYGLWHTQYKREVEGGRLLPDSRAMVLQQCGKSRWAGGMQGRSIRAQTTRSKRTYCKGQREECVQSAPFGLNMNIIPYFILCSAYSTCRAVKFIYNMDDTCCKTLVVYQLRCWLQDTSKRKLSDFFIFFAPPLFLFPTMDQNTRSGWKKIGFIETLAGLTRKKASTRRVNRKITDSTRDQRALFSRYLAANYASCRLQNSDSLK